MTEDRLFRTPVGYQATFRLEANGTWTAIVDTFYEGEMWSHEDRNVYERLSLLEACETLLCELSAGRL